MKKFSLTLSKNSLLTIYKTFVWPILDYTDIINDKNLTESFKDKLEMVQYNAALVFTGATKDTSGDTSRGRKSSVCLFAFLYLLFA